MAYWIIKSEPNTYSFEDLARDGRTCWDGVRNYQARNNLKLMKSGDLALVYHSVGPKELVGMAEVVKNAYKDPSSDDDAWVAVDVKFKSFLKHPIKLASVKADPRLSSLALVKQGRLSVAPVTKEQWRILLSLSEQG